MGIERYDSDARFRATLRNFDFFDAPTAAIVGLDGRLAQSGLRERHVPGVSYISKPMSSTRAEWVNAPTAK